MQIKCHSGVDSQVTGTQTRLETLKSTGNLTIVSCLRFSNAFSVQSLEETQMLLKSKNHWSALRLHSQVTTFDTDTKLRAARRSR